MKQVNLKEAEEFILSLTAEKCDTIALEQGSMSICITMERPPNHLTKGRIIDGWTMFWIPIQKDPSIWRLVLGADTIRNHQLAQEGRVRRLIEEYDVARAKAERYVEAAKGIQYGFEDIVIKMVMESDHHRREWDNFPGPSPAIRFWLNAYPTYVDVNHSRLVAANRIIKSLWGESEITPSGIGTLKAYNSRHPRPIPLPQHTTLIGAWS